VDRLDRGTVVILAVSQQVTKSGLDQEIYQSSSLLQTAPALVHLANCANGLFAGTLGSLAWFHGHDTFLTVMNVALG
jgi:hypothetical protein